MVRQSFIVHFTLLFTVQAVTIAGPWPKALVAISHFHASGQAARGSHFQKEKVRSPLYATSYCWCQKSLQQWP
jgi:hypothetical protein